MQTLTDLIKSHEEWLLERVAQYARERLYAKYTSTLREAGRIAIEGLSKSLIQAWEYYGQKPEFGPDDDFIHDPIAQFGLLEAKKHRERGVSLTMFMGLMKYYRQSYLDLIKQSDFTLAEKEKYELLVLRVFDRMEIAFCAEWGALLEDQKLQELQNKNRLVVNEKNKYQTIFESISNPVFLFDSTNRLEYLNFAAAELLQVSRTPGSLYYGNNIKKVLLPNWLLTALNELAQSGQKELIFEEKLEVGKDTRIFEVKLSKMLDISDKFSGTTAIFNEITQRKKTETALKESEQKYRALVDNAVNGVVLILDDEFAYVNQAYADIVGYRLDELYELPLLFLLLDKSLGKYTFMKQYQYLIRGKKSMTVFEAQILTKTGHIVEVLVSAARIILGGEVGVIGLVVDISERKRIETEREKLIQDLEKALKDIKILSGLIPICSSCKKIRDDQGYWHQVEEYLSKRSDVLFSHGICPDCMKRLYPQYYKDEG
jgi:PAS domain S-box-containing protein